MFYTCQSGVRSHNEVKGEIKGVLTGTCGLPQGLCSATKNKTQIVATDPEVSMLRRPCLPLVVDFLGFMIYVSKPIHPFGFMTPTGR